MAALFRDRTPAESHELGCPLVPEGLVIRTPEAASPVRTTAKIRRASAQAT